MPLTPLRLRGQAREVSSHHASFRLQTDQSDFHGGNGKINGKCDFCGCRRTDGLQPASDQGDDRLITIDDLFTDQIRRSDGRAHV